MGLLVRLDLGDRIRVTTRAMLREVRLVTRFTRSAKTFAESDGPT